MEQLTSYADDVILIDGNTLARGNLAGSTAYYSLHLQHAFLFVCSSDFLSVDLFLIPARSFHLTECKCAGAERLLRQ